MAGRHRGAFLTPHLPDQQAPFLEILRGLGLKVVLGIEGLSGKAGGLGFLDSRVQGTGFMSA